MWTIQYKLCSFFVSFSFLPLPLLFYLFLSHSLSLSHYFLKFLSLPSYHFWLFILAFSVYQSMRKMMMMTMMMMMTRKRDGLAVLLAGREMIVKVIVTYNFLHTDFMCVCLSVSYSLTSNLVLWYHPVRYF